MSIDLYFNPLSQPSRAVSALLLLGKVPFQPHNIDFMKQEQFTEEYTKISPTNNVPAIVDGDFKLFESHAILKYIARKHKLEQFYPNDIKLQATIDSYLDWHHTGTRYTTTVARDLVFYPKFLGKAVPENKNDLLKNLDEFITSFEKVFLDNGKNEYILGQPKCTIADISAVSELTTLFLLAEFDFSKHQVLIKYLTHVLEIPEIREAHAPYFGFVKSQFPEAGETFKEILK